jgi:hypothetical protein
MIGRGLPRDYSDPGLRVIDVAHSMQLLDRLPDAPFADYGRRDDDVLQVRRSLRDWPRDHDQDQAGRSVRAQQAGRSAESLAADGFPTPLQGALTEGLAVPEVASRSPGPAHTQEQTDNRGSDRRGN